MIKPRSIAKIRKFCREPLENIENYYEAMTSPEKWCCHHRWGISPVGVFSKEYLISIGLYYNRPACELVFMRESEHLRLHNTHRREETRDKLAAAARKFFTGRKHSEETRRKISESKLGDKNPMYGKPGTNLGKKFTEEHRANMSKAMKGKRLSEETKRKLSEAMSGENHPFYGTHFSEETKKKISKSQDPYKVPVQAFKDGVLVGTFSSQCEAAKKLGVDTGGIAMVMHGKCHQHKGYTFRRAS